MRTAIRDYRAADEAALLDLWNRALPYDPIDPGTFRTKVLLDPNVRAENLLLAEQDGALVGFCLWIRRRVPLEQVGLEPERAWISAMGVRPESRRQGVGAALLAEVEARTDGCSLFVTPYVPNYFVPGIDVDRYPDGVSFFEHHGFKTFARPLSMDANLVTFDFTPYHERAARLAERGIHVRQMTSADIVPLLEFLEQHTWGDWLRAARELLAGIVRGGTFAQFSLAFDGETIIGYCQWEHEHFGPFGIREDRRGEGVGTVLLAHCLETMRAHGRHNAWVLWTSDETAARVYARFGFRESRRFAVMRRQVQS